MKKKINFNKFDIYLLNRITVIFSLGLLSVLTFCSRPDNSEKTESLKEYEKYNAEIVKHIYPYIRTIANGPRINAEIGPGQPNQRGEHSFYFRLVVKMYETWDLIYLERIGVFDEEGMECRLTDQIFIELQNVFPEISKGESRYTNKIEWLSNYSAKLVINEKEYMLNVNDFLQE